MSRASLDATSPEPLASTSGEPFSNENVCTEPHPQRPYEEEDDENMAQLFGTGQAQLDQRDSDQSIGDEICRICHLDEESLPALGVLVSPCLCRGTMALVHVTCLERWLTECGSDKCELCGFRYQTERIPRHGLFRSIALWMTSGIDAKLLLFDLIWFAMATPIAMFATYLMMLSISVIQQAAAAGTKQQSGLALFLLATSSLLLTTYYVWLVNCFRHHMREWYRWWRRNYIIHVIDTGERRRETSRETTIPSDVAQVAQETT